MTLKNVATASLLALGLAISGPTLAQSKSSEGSKTQSSAQSSKSEKSSESQSAKASESDNASGGQTAGTPLESRADREPQRNPSWLGLLGLLGLAGLLRRRTPDRDRDVDVRTRPGSGGRRVGVYDK